ncbi:MAG: hypothetical protein MJ252_14150 [archaeon]|nr:hypothetical protein [archaeon]
MLFGHGMKIKKFGKGEFTTTYQLAFGDKIKTETFYNSKFKVPKPYMFHPAEEFDNSDWNYRKFKCYKDFTKEIDRKTILQK